MDTANPTTKSDLDIGPRPDESPMLVALEQLAPTRDGRPAQTDEQDLLNKVWSRDQAHDLKLKQDLKTARVEEAAAKPSSDANQIDVADLQAAREEQKNIDEMLEFAEDQLKLSLKEFDPEEVKLLFKATEIEGRIIEKLAQGRAIARVLSEINPSWEKSVAAKVSRYLQSKIFHGKENEKMAKEFENQLDYWVEQLKSREVIMKKEDYDEAKEIYDTWINNIKEKSVKALYQNRANARLLEDPHVQVAQGITPFN